MKIKLDENLPERLVGALSDIRQFVPGTHCGLLLVRLRAPGRVALFDRIHSLFAAEDVSTWSGCLIVTTERKLRVRRSDGPR